MEMSSTDKIELSPKVSCIVTNCTCEIKTSEPQLMVCTCVVHTENINTECCRSPNISIKHMHHSLDTNNLVNSSEIQQQRKSSQVSQGTGFVFPDPSTTGSPHHLIAGHTNSTRKSHSRSNSGTILKCTCDVPPISPKSPVYTNHPAPQMDHSPHYIRSHSLASTGLKSLNLKNTHVLEKSRSLSEKRSPKNLRSTKSLSPRPPVKHQHSIYVSDESKDFLAVKMPVPVSSPHKELSALSTILANCEHRGKNTNHSKKSHSENASPNLSDNNDKPRTIVSTASAKSSSCLVYEPLDPWTKMTDVEKSKNVLTKTNHFSLEDPWRSPLEDPFITSIPCSANRPASVSWFGHEVPAVVTYVNKPTPPGNTLRIPSYSFDIMSYCRGRPKLERCKSPVNVSDQPEAEIMNLETKTPSPLQMNDQHQITNSSPKKHRNKADLHQLDNFVRSPKLVPKSPKFCRSTSRNAEKSPESDCSSLLPDQLNCTCENVKKSPRQSPRKLSPNLGYTSLSNDIEFNDSSRNIVTLTPVKNKKSLCYQKESIQSINNDELPITDKYLLCDKVKCETPEKEIVLNDTCYINKIGEASTSSLSDKHKDTKPDLPDPLLETTC